MPGISSPSAVALVGSPFQALSLLEYVRVAGIRSGLVFVNRLPDPAMLTPTFNTLARLDGDFTFRFRPRGGFGHPTEKTGEVARDLADVVRAAGLAEAPLILGDYRETVGWRLARDLDRGADEVVVLDDGNMTMLIDRTEGGVRPLTWSDEAERGGFLPLPAVTFFTAYPDLLAAAAGDVIRTNTWAWVREQYAGLPRSESVTLVVGQGLTRVGVTDEILELRIARELIATARDLHPQSSPLYMAHRAESAAKLRTLSAECDVVRFDVPAELVPVDAGVLPAAIVGNYSTVLTSFADLVPGAIPIHAVNLPFEELLDRRKRIKLAYDEYQSRYAGIITVVDPRR
jgi:hypothetical protein